MTVSNRRLIPRSGLDHYPTPEWGTEALLRHVEFRGRVLEPCCGDGAMARVLERSGLEVIASDIIEHGYGRLCDFFDIFEPVSNIVTNPPFNLAEGMLLHALSLAKEKVCFLLRTAFLESRRRFETIYSKTPPSKLLVFSERLTMYPHGQPVKGGGTTSFSWFVWDKSDTSGLTKIEWISPGSKPRNLPAMSETEIDLIG